MIKKKFSLSGIDNYSNGWYYKAWDWIKSSRWFLTHSLMHNTCPAPHFLLISLLRRILKLTLSSLGTVALWGSGQDPRICHKSSVFASSFLRMFSWDCQRVLCFFLSFLLLFFFLLLFLCVGRVGCDWVRWGTFGSVVCVRLSRSLWSLRWRTWFGILSFPRSFIFTFFLKRFYSLSLSFSRSWVTLIMNIYISSFAEYL